MVYSTYSCTIWGIISGHFLHINVAFCTFRFVPVLVLFGFKPFIYRAFGAFSFFAIFVPPILLFIIATKLKAVNMIFFIKTLLVIIAQI